MPLHFCFPIMNNIDPDEVQQNAASYQSLFLCKLQGQKNNECYKCIHYCEIIQV